MVPAGNCQPQVLKTGMTTLESDQPMTLQGFRGTISFMSAPEHNLQCSNEHQIREPSGYRQSASVERCQYNKINPYHSSYEKRE